MASTAVQDPYARHVLARMFDFFADERTPWPRRLWDIGSVLALEELWEAGHWQAHNVLAASALDLATLGQGVKVFGRPPEYFG